MQHLRVIIPSSSWGGFNDIMFCNGTRNCCRERGYSRQRYGDELSYKQAEEAQYNQAYKVMDQLHTINRDRYIIAVEYLVRVVPDCNRSYCEDSFSGYTPAQ